MTTRIYSHKHQLYTNSLNWPSNQRTWSEWVITPEGQILEIIDDGSGPFVERHDKRNFSIEPWTGFFDANGKKIYRGDILKMESMFDFVSEVEWKNGAFWLKPLDKEGIDQQLTQSSVKNWKITDNIHNAEFFD